MSNFKGITSGRTVRPQHLRRLCQWLEELNNGEMIEGPNWSRNYLGFDSITQQELDTLALLANGFLINYRDGFLLGNSMGEIIPGKMQSKE